MANHALVRRYRNESKLRKAIPRSELLVDLPRSPFVGEINYAQIRTVLQANKRFMTRAERVAAEELDGYLQFKKGPTFLANGNGNGFHHRPSDSTNGTT
jgi:hypothetical protein